MVDNTRPNPTQSKLLTLLKKANQIIDSIRFDPKMADRKLWHDFEVPKEQLFIDLDQAWLNNTGPNQPRSNQQVNESSVQNLKCQNWTFISFKKKKTEYSFK